jgi:NADH-quinone oxidoreductase subunit L
MSTLGGLLLALPLAAAAILWIFGARLKGKAPGLVAFLAAASCFVVALVAFLKLRALPVDERAVESLFWRWIDVGAGGAGAHLSLAVGVLLDPLSLTWTLFVTGVGSLIFLYSIAYMEHEQGYARYFAYLCLFLFSMLVLVLGSSLALTFVGWEGVGLCSYLLIGFEYGKETAANAGRKAFVVNRIGDVGFLLGMFWTWKTFGTLEYGTSVTGGHPALLAALRATAAVPALAALAYFLGAVGKSAQLPLFVWLPDAMAGPTPVSALIHAATMVTAGVYLLCRLSPLFVVADYALHVVAWVGAATALFSALIALRQRDVKRVLAYSTVSQLGYMFLACGLGAFSSAAFHVVTHSFFKALLFLGSGAVIHALHGEQDLWKMGGLKHALPRTASAMKWGALALAGIAPFAGFFSKDEILGVAFAQGYAGERASFALWGVGVVTAALTAFYTARLVALAFEGEWRGAKDVHPHEAPAPMAFALTVLKWLSLAGGLVLGVEALGTVGVHWTLLHDWLEPTLAKSPGEVEAALPTLLPWALMTFAFLLAVLSWRVAKNMFRGDFAAPRALELSSPRLANAIANRFWVDEVYGALVVRPLRATAALCLDFDRRVVDGLFRGLANVAAFLGTVVRLLQNGVVHAYSFWFLVGAAFLLWLALR